VYKDLRHINPAPFAAFMNIEDFSIVSSSPERFLEIKNNIVQTRPIKGTRSRGKNKEEDLINRQELIDSEKDKSELLMIVDLERNDLSKVCKPYSVKVTELFKLEEYSTVFHLVSTVVGELKDKYTAVDCIKACFPGGSITGAPKVRSMEVIEELEPTRRSIYTGCIGYLGFDGNADLNIVIRTILIKEGQAYLGVGGGITWESEKEAEYQETLDKAKALMRVL
jgi:para-aminobenzoate synthetase component 1